ncbi:hypothetical protein HELRODRAFT_169937 [Helobdella robusta]|uniref:Calponin-homology (CH) domain-containing protein n=1 Tax=Helobdella robusta TaxID=6412 RepID=T1F2G4_HELRO|nr:hypothetical protein HELRODRAFT_169937 [Helobdella robusta]ESO08198.1 hypothetical protein HELRODRAFT_169937 [Helobdella robusta]
METEVLDQCDDMEKLQTMLDNSDDLEFRRLVRLKIRKLKKGGSNNIPTARQALRHFKQIDKEVLLRNNNGSKDILDKLKRISPSNPNNIKEQTLNWCKNRLSGYENINIEDFSASWSDGLAFCALANSFFPSEFDYDQLTNQNRRFNFKLAFDVLEDKAGIAPLLDVEDMLTTSQPDWRCVFTYVNSVISRMSEIKKQQQLPQLPQQLKQQLPQQLEHQDSLQLQEDEVNDDDNVDSSLKSHADNRTGDSNNNDVDDDNT